MQGDARICFSVFVSTWMTINNLPYITDVVNARYLLHVKF